MKKIFSLFLAFVASAGTLLAGSLEGFAKPKISATVSTSDGNAVYLKFPDLSDYGYKVAVWSWKNGGSNDSWSSWMTAVSNHEDWYKTTINNSHDNIIFALFDENDNTPNWSTAQFQSVDLQYSEQNAYFVLNSAVLNSQNKLFDFTIQNSFDGQVTPPIETTYSVNLSIIGNGSGNITLYNGNTQVASGTSISETLGENSNIRFVLAIDDNSSFIKWSDGNTSLDRSITLTQNINLQAEVVKTDVLEPCRPANGDGTKNNEYKITQACELLWYAQNYQSGDYAILDADISLNNVAWTPIGSKQKPYNAHIDGRNHYISDFIVVADTAGLFGYAKGADIRNIKVRNASVTGKQYTGIICGYASQTDIIACDNWAVVNGQLRTGGICGYLDNATISNCLNEGAVTATGDYAGGIAGRLNAAEVVSCTNNKSVSSQADYVGGIVGGIDGSSSISVCSSSADATVHGKNYVGGLCGNVAQGSTMTESINEGAVYATDKECGGLVGRFEGSIAEHLYNYGYVESSSSQVGGVMGSSKNNSKLESCVNTGTIVATQDRHVGGIIGDASQTSIIASINIGQIQGKDLTGGIVGYFYESSTMVCCANYGAVSGASKVGGLTGESRAKMTKSFSTGYVKGTGSNIGGISGNLFQSQYADNCLFDNQMCPLANAFGSGSGDGEGVTTLELLGGVSALSGSFNLSNYNTCSWTMDNNGYPRPSTLADKPVAAAGASAIILAEGDNADSFAHPATLTKVNNAKWTSKGGTQINGAIATPSILGQDELYVTKGEFVKIVPIYITGTEAFDKIELDVLEHKILINGQLYIIRGEKIYTATGQEVR
ncbi:MAG: hypothetical protein IJV28_02270 [Paludibacteraceae bacterium]|nr:hypothetical protein [Paludibacteraceae bacterium]